MKSLILVLLIVMATSGQKREDSKTERVLKAWVVMQNEGTDAAVRRFIDGYYSPALLEKMKNYEAHVKFYKQIINEFGPVQEIIYHTEETSANKLKVQLLKVGRTLVPEPTPEEILVVNIDLDPKNQDYLARGLGLGALVCYIKR